MLITSGNGIFQGNIFVIDIRYVVLLFKFHNILKKKKKRKTTHGKTFHVLSFRWVKVCKLLVG